MSTEDEDEDDFEYDFDEEEEILTCTACGREANEEQVNESWVSLMRYGDNALGTFAEVLVCVKCSESEEKLRKAFEVFLKELGAKNREAMT
jgi:hypothetical protein